jgi:hypothetical protein
MPRLDKHLQRAPQLYSRIAFAYQMGPLSEEETRFFLEQRGSHRVNTRSDDFTNQEAIAAIHCVTRGNIRSIERLMMQVELILVTSALTVVTKDIVEIVRQNLTINNDLQGWVEQARMSYLKIVHLLRQRASRRVL